MIVKTLGIVVKTIKYGDNAAISNIFTHELGLVGFHIPSAFSSKGKIKSSYLIALNVLEISFNYNKNKNLQSIADISCKKFIQLNGANQQAYYTVCTEAVQQLIKEQEINHELFHYLSNDFQHDFQSNIHFWQLPSTLLSLLYHYGCSPNIHSFKQGYYLDLMEGVFKAHNNLKQCAKEDSSQLVYDILTNNIAQKSYDVKLRNEIINDLIIYYKIHVNENFDLKSRQIWYDVMTS